MSYARFSYDSDVYVYMDVFGDYVVHIAKYRHVNENMPYPHMPDFGASPTVLAEYIKARDEWFDASHVETISGPYSDTTSVLSTPLEAITLLNDVRAAGYLVPQYAIDTLMEEHNQEKAGSPVRNHAQERTN